MKGKSLLSMTDCKNSKIYTENTIIVSGYSKTPLYKKLGYKPSLRICVYNPPENYISLFKDSPDGINIQNLHTEDNEIDIIHFFTKSKTNLISSFSKLASQITKDGVIWISWPKKSSKVPTDLDGNLVRSIGLSLGLVDIKVAAINDIWSGLKFVIRKENR